MRSKVRKLAWVVAVAATALVALGYLPAAAADVAWPWAVIAVAGWIAVWLASDRQPATIERWLVRAGVVLVLPAWLLVHTVQSYGPVDGIATMLGVGFGLLGLAGLAFAGAIIARLVTRGYEAESSVR